MLAMLPLAVRGKTMLLKPSRKLGHSSILFLLSFGLLWTIFLALTLTVATTLAVPIAHFERDHIEGWHGKMDVDLAVKTVNLPGPKWVPAPVDVRRRNDSNESGCVTVNGRRLCNNDHPGKGCQLYPSRKCPPPSGGGSSGGGGNNNGGGGGGGGDGNTTEVSSPGDTIATVTSHAGLREFTASKQKVSILDQHCEAHPTYRECLPNRSSGGGNCQLYPSRKCPPKKKGGGGDGNTTEIPTQDDTIAQSLKDVEHLAVTKDADFIGLPVSINSFSDTEGQVVAEERGNNAQNSDVRHKGGDDAGIVSPRSQNPATENGVGMQYVEREHAGSRESPLHKDPA